VRWIHTLRFDFAGWFVQLEWPSACKETTQCGTMDIPRRKQWLKEGTQQVERGRGM